MAATVRYPEGVYPVYGGSAELQARPRRELLVHSVMAGVGIVLLLALVFRAGRNLLLILANLPFALVGGVLAVFASGGVLSIGTLVGFVTLFGITMRNSIMMISHFEHLVREEGLAWGPETGQRFHEAPRYRRQAAIAPCSGEQKPNSGAPHLLHLLRVSALEARFFGSSLRLEPVRSASQFVFRS